MRESRPSPGARAEKQQLLVLGIGLAAIGAGAWWLFGLHALNILMLTLAGLALAGCLAYRAMGRGVFLVFSLLSLAVGRVVSWLMVLVLYVVVIAGLGTVLRLFGMNRLERNFEACRKKGTMLVDVPRLDPAGFRRQS
jgi:ABC-type sugar transport system permease subunit